jgi:hypothetical protein
MTFTGHFLSVKIEQYLRELLISHTGNTLKLPRLSIGKKSIA